MNDKAGYPIYSGTVSLSEEWQFRVMGKWDALAKDKDCDQKRTELASKVSDALRDDAMKISMDLGLGKLIHCYGFSSHTRWFSDSSLDRVLP